MLCVFVWDHDLFAYVRHFFQTPVLPSMSDERWYEGYWFPHWGPAPDRLMDPERN